MPQIWTVASTFLWYNPWNSVRNHYVFYVSGCCLTSRASFSIAFAFELAIEKVDILLPQDLRFSAEEKNGFWCILPSCHSLMWCRVSRIGSHFPSSFSLTGEYPSPWSRARRISITHSPSTWWKNESCQWASNMNTVKFFALWQLYWNLKLLLLHALMAAHSPRHWQVPMTFRPQEIWKIADVLLHRYET